MKKIIVVMIILAMVLSTMACNAVANESLGTNDEENNAIVIKEDESSSECTLVETIPFSIVSIDDLKDRIKNQIDLSRVDASYEVIKDDQDTYIVIYMGEKSTGGYDVTVDQVIVTEDGYSVQVLENQPAKDAMVTMAFTYPLVVIKVESDEISEDNILVNRYSNQDQGINDQEETYLSNIDHFKEGEIITLGQIIEFDKNRVHVISGDIVQVFSSDIELLENFYIGQSVEVIKSNTGIEMNAYVRDDFEINFTSMGNRIFSAEGQVSKVEDGYFELTTEDETLAFEGGQMFYLEEGEFVIVESVDFNGDYPYAIEVLKATQAYDFKILGINRLENGYMQIQATEDVNSEEVSYIVTLDQSTSIRLNLSELQVGDKIKAYAEVVLESYPMQMVPKRITK